MKIAAIVLAAGCSVRMAEPKALVKFGPKTFLETVLVNLEQAGVAESVVVLGHAADQILDRVNLASAQFVVNKDYLLGQFSSFQTGLKKLNETVAGVFLALVDQPQIGADLLARIKQAFVERPRNIVIPTCEGRRGHPPIFPRLLFREILAAPSSQSAADLIHKNAEKVYELELAEESVLWNVNTRNDLLQIQRRLASSRI
ncbi:MAG: NTP transferase domain-containing protein [bacterium]